MASNVKQPKRFNAAKWTLIAIIVAAAIVGNVYFGAYSLAVRAAVLIVVALFVLGMAVTTNKGSAAWGFLKDARTEMRKVVWPTRRETIQTTMVVIAIVFIMCLILWGFDSLFAFFVSQIII